MKLKSVAWRSRSNVWNKVGEMIVVHQLSTKTIDQMKSKNDSIICHVVFNKIWDQVQGDVRAKK